MQLLGISLLAIDFEQHDGQDEAEPELGPPFGFSGSATLQAERAEDWALAEDHQRTADGRWT